MYINFEYHPMSKNETCLSIIDLHNRHLYESHRKQHKTASSSPRPLALNPHWPATPRNTYHENCCMDTFSVPDLLNGLGFQGQVLTDFGLARLWKITIVVQVGRKQSTFRPWNQKKWNKTRSNSWNSLYLQPPMLMEVFCEEMWRHFP